MTFRFKQFHVPPTWPSHWPYRFDMFWDGDFGDHTRVLRQSMQTLYERLSLLDEVDSWCLREIGKGGPESQRWNRLKGQDHTPGQMVFIHDADHAVAFKLRFC